MPKTVILGTARTPFGKMGGSLASVDAIELGGAAIRGALERPEVAPQRGEHAALGPAPQAGAGRSEA